MAATRFVKLACFNVWRAELYNTALKELAKALATNNVPSVYVDGSYLEENPYPRDIDAFFELTPQQYKAMFVVFGINTFKDWHLNMKSHRIDAYPSVIGSTNVSKEGMFFNTDLDYWLWKFHKSKDGIEKGIAYLGTADILTETPS